MRPEEPTQGDPAEPGIPAVLTKLDKVLEKLDVILADLDSPEDDAAEEATP
jgi:hypothetical protein